jgi:hypothetical protein
VGSAVRRYAGDTSADQRKCFRRLVSTCVEQTHLRRPSGPSRRQPGLE